MTNWTSEIDSITGQFLTSFGTLSHAQLNWKPNAQTWSIAQNIDHLIVINESYFSSLKALKEGTYKTPFFGKIGFMVSFLGKAVLKAVNPDRKKKVKTFSIWEPTIGDIDENILKRFEEHQSELKAQIASSKELLKRGTVISSPANKNVVYKLETALEIIVSHERRHLEQAREVLQQLSRSTSQI